MGGAGQTRHVSRYKKYPSFVWVSNCGFPEKGQFEVLQLACARSVRNDKADVIAQIYRSQGPLLTASNPAWKPVLDRYKELLRQAGSELVLRRAIPAGLQAELDKPLIPEDEYSKGANQSWDVKG